MLKNAMGHFGTSFSGPLCNCKFTPFWHRLGHVNLLMDIDLSARICIPMTFGRSHALRVRVALFVAG